MTAFLYPHGKGAMLRKKIGWIEDDIKVALIDKEFYTPAPENDAHLSDIPEKAVLHIGDLSGRKLLLSVAFGSDMYFPMVSAGNPGAVVIYSASAKRNTSWLIMYTDEIDGLPFSANGSDFWLRWSKGKSSIFKL